MPLKGCRRSRPAARVPEQSGPGHLAPRPSTSFPRRGRPTPTVQASSTFQDPKGQRSPSAPRKPAGEHRPARGWRGGGLDTWSRDPEQATHRLTRTGLARRRSPEEGGPGGEEKVLRVLLEAAVAAAHAAGPDARRGPPRGAGGQAGVRRPPAPRGSRRAAPSRRPAVLLQLRPPLKTPSEPLPRAPPPSPRASRLG